MRAAVLSLHDLWPVTGGTARTLAFCHALVEAGVEVACIYPSSNAPPDLSSPVRWIPVPTRPLGQRSWPTWVTAAKRAVAPMPSQMGARSPGFVDELRALGSLDLLVVPGASTAPLVRELPTGGRLWLDFHDALSRYARRESRYLPAGTATAARLQAMVLARNEAVAMGEAAVVTTAGAGDADALGERRGQPVAWLPTPVDAPAHVPPPTGSRRIGFIGTFGYQPNRDAVDVLVTAWRQPLEAAGWQLVVAGRGSADLTLPASVTNLGEVDDVADFYAAVDAVAVPVRRGGGMKVKVVEALLYGRPVLGTAFALEGFRGLPATHVLDEDRPLIPADAPPPTTDEIATVSRTFSPATFGQTVARLLP